MIEYLLTLAAVLFFGIGMAVGASLATARTSEKRITGAVGNQMVAPGSSHVHGFAKWPFTKDATTTTHRCTTSGCVRVQTRHTWS